MTTRRMAAIPARLRDRWSPGARALLRKGVWALADQALISATNFATMVLVARVLTPREFGLYSLAYTGLLFTNSVQSSLVTQPHASLGAPRAGSAYVSYTTDTAWLQAGFGLLTALVVLGVGMALHVRDLWIAPMVIALAPAALAWQLQEFVRRAMYVTTHLGGAFVNDVVSYGGQLALLVGLWQQDMLTPVTAILAIAGTSAAAFVLGAWQVRDQLDRSLFRPQLRATLRENWLFGKWLLGGNLAFWTSGQLYPIVAAALVSVSATGLMRAAQTILGPTTVVVTALDSLFSPRAARSYARGGLEELRTSLARMETLVTIAIGTYCLVVAVFAKPIFGLVYGPEYARQSWMLTVVALATLLASLRLPVRIGLKAIRQTNAIFHSYGASSAVNLTLGVLIVQRYGTIGLGVGLMLNSLVLQAVTWHYQRKWLGGSLRGRHGAARTRNDTPQAISPGTARDRHHLTERSVV